MGGIRTVRRARAGRSGSIARESVPCGRDDLGMEAESEVVVRAAHEGPPPRDHHLGGAAHLVDDRVEGKRALAESGEALRDRLKLIEKIHQPAIHGREARACPPGSGLSPLHA
jgi:hypothetical protein